MIRASMPPARDKRLRIVQDMTFADRSLTGTRIYARQLRAALEATERYEIVTVAAPTRTRRPGEGNLLSGLRNVIWLQRDLPSRLAAERADLVHEAAFVGTLRAPCPMIVNVLDTVYAWYPEDFNYKWRLYARFWIGPTARRAAAVITLSEFAQAGIMAAYHIPRERIHVIYPGISEAFRPVQDTEALARVRAKYSLNDDLLLFVGASEGRKNIVALVQAMAKLKATGRFPELQLALVGPRGSAWTQISRTIEREQLVGTVIPLGFIPEEDLALLYAGARCFVFPSRMEGFGIPLIEAMACGTPVVAAPCPPVPEVVSDAALLADDAGATALAVAIERVLCDGELAQRLRARGLERARVFTWARSAQQMGQVYQEVAARRGHSMPL